MNWKSPFDPEEDLKISKEGLKEMYDLGKSLDLHLLQKLHAQTNMEKNTHGILPEVNL